ncbi:unnamed protein product [Moneuplotes crassus]|uniref:Uncharacterized protein n=1 Tax=Euplotes crassus TaxID=5936 RepID=A0AAD2D799_EUPCR|nr:unnamed protein product [Moneuplotes crassus]
MNSEYRVIDALDKKIVIQELQMTKPFESQEKVDLQRKIEIKNGTRNGTLEGMSTQQQERNKKLYYFQKEKELLNTKKSRNRKKYEEVDYMKYDTDPKKIPKMITQITNMYKTQVGTQVTDQKETELIEEKLVNNTDSKYCERRNSLYEEAIKIIQSISSNRSISEAPDDLYTSRSRSRSRSVNNYASSEARLPAKDFNMESIIENSENSSKYDDDIDKMSLEKIEKNARKRLLSIRVQKAESIVNMQSLRRVHDSKLKLQKKMLRKIADDISMNRLEILQNMFSTELNTFFKNYDDLHEICIRQVHNESKLIKIVYEQEKVLLERKIMNPFVKEDNFDFSDVVKKQQDLLKMAQNKSTKKLNCHDSCINLLSQKEHEFETMKLFNHQMIDEINYYKNQISEKDLQLKELKSYYEEQQKLKELEISALKKSQLIQVSQLQSMKQSMDETEKIDQDYLSQLEEKDKLIQDLQAKLKELAENNKFEIEPIQVITIDKSSIGTQTEEIEKKEKQEIVPKKRNKRTERINTALFDKKKETRNRPMVNTWQIEFKPIGNTTVIDNFTKNNLSLTSNNDALIKDCKPIAPKTTQNTQNPKEIKNRK